MNTEEKSNTEEIEEGVNAEEKTDALIKGVSLVLSLFAIKAFVNVEYVFDAFTWFVLLFFGMVVLLIAEMMTGVKRNVVKDIVFYAASFLLATVLFNVALLFALLYFPFLRFTEAALIVLLAVTLLLDVKICAFPGKADEKLSKAFWGLLFASSAIYGLYCLLMLKALIILPILIGFGTLIALEKGKQRYSRVHVLAICLSGVLAGEISCVHVTYEDPCGTEESVSQENEAEKKELPPLFAAMRDGDKEALEKLAKTDVNSVYEIERRPISPLLAATVKEDAEIVDILIKAGADVNYGLDDGDTAFGWAIRSNNFEIARKLADAGAEMKTRRNMSVWLLGWLGGLKKRIDFRIFALLWEKKAPLFVEGTTISERLFFPFGLVKK